MPRLRVTFPVRTALLLTPLLLSACGEPDTSGSTTGTTTSNGGGGSSSTTSSGGGGSGAGGATGGTGGATGGTGGATTGGTGGATGGTGGAGGATALLCGNGAIDAGEDCDGAELGGATCVSIGFPGGALGCNAACHFDTGACSDSDFCADGIDNNANGKVDCEELDCADECASACFAPIPMADGEAISGYTVGHAAVLPSSCVAESGPELVYALTATQTGALDVSLVEDSGAPLSISVRTDCASDDAEIACSDAYLPGTGNQKYLTVPITQGQTVFVVVDGDGASAAGSFTVLAQTRAIFCGDGHEDPPDTCDDGNTASGDGCDASCQVESTESEPNGSIATADPLAAPWYARIDPAGDVDVVQLSLPAAGGLAAWTEGLGDGACLDGSLDTALTLLDAAGNTLASNDDHAGACSFVSVASLPPGVYYARIEAPAGASQAAATFPYQLHTSAFHCGDGALEAGEQCDDGNAANGDGCSSSCKVEVNESEPNGTLPLADVYTSPWVARVDPDGDVDVVLVTVPAGGSKITATTMDPKGGAGCVGAIDTYVEILGAGGAVLAVNDDANGGTCSSASAQGLAAGTYYVRVQAPPLLGADNVFIYSYKLDIKVQ